MKKMRKAERLAQQRGEKLYPITLGYLARGKAGWVSVAYELPEDNEPVLTCDYKGNVHIMRHSHFYQSPFGIDKNDPHYHRVRFWMPLPETPKIASQRRALKKRNAC